VHHPFLFGSKFLYFYALFRPQEITENVYHKNKLKLNMGRHYELKIYVVDTPSEWTEEQTRQATDKFNCNTNIIK